MTSPRHARDTPQGRYYTDPAGGPDLYARALADFRAIPTSGYTPPAARPQQWAAMARELAAAGRAMDDIAAALSVAPDTVTRLLNHTT